MVAPNPVDRPWHRADYILRGEYCPLSAVHNHLKRTREALGATMLVHLAIDHEFVMRSLSWTAGSPSGANQRLSDWIRGAGYKEINRALNDNVVEVAKRWKSGLVGELSDQLAGEIIRGLLGIRYEGESGSTKRLPVSIRGAIPAGPWGGFVLNHTGRQGVEPWDGEVRSLLLVTPKPVVDGLADDRHLQDLGVMLKCTAEANVRRDAVVMGQVAQRLSFSPLQHGGDSLRSVSADALELACEITGSQGGAVYLSSTSGEPHFECLARRMGPRFSYPSTLALNAKTTVGWCVERHRAYHQISGSAAPQSLVRAVESLGGTELVTPIAGPLADTWAPAVGAIVLFHGEGESRGYSAYERALVRNVALRLALFRTNSATREIATAISVLRSRSPRRLQTAAEEPTSAVRPSWPRDVVRATERFDETLSRLAASTHSHSVTLRIALPDEERPSGHGLLLARVAAYPAARLDEPYEQEREGDPGLHWDVMHKGTEQYVARIEGDSRFPQVRPGSKSAVCVPVKVEGILAGTLNLESPFPDNYASLLPLVVALAGAVGRTFADARAEIEGDVLDRTAQALARKHEYSGVLTEMRNDLEIVNPESLREKLGDKVEKLRTVIQDLREPGVPAKIPARTLWRLVEDTLQETQLGAVREAPSETMFYRPLSPRATQAIMTVLVNVFRNVNYHSTSDGRDRDGRPMPRVTSGVTLLDGAQQAVIFVENLSKRLLTLDLCAELYRYPLAPSSEIRLGTYIAGLNARRVGARIHATPIQDGRALRTTLIIPMESLYDTTDSADVSYSGRG
jgi:hypothetical protein